MGAHLPTMTEKMLWHDDEEENIYVYMNRCILATTSSSVDKRNWRLVTTVTATHTHTRKKQEYRPEIMSCEQR